MNAPTGQNQAARETLALDGAWEFRFEGPTAALKGTRAINVPGIWQTQFPELRNAQGMGFYRRRIDVPEGFAGKRVFLVMDGIFHESTISVNGAPVASHHDGWTEAVVDLTDAIAGASSFELGVDARVPDDRGAAGAGFSGTLAGKQDWYGVHGGIWKPCRLEARDATHIAQADVRASLVGRQGRVRVRGALSLGARASITVSLSRAGAVVAQTSAALDGDVFDVVLDSGDVETWSPDAPRLYDVAIRLSVDGQIVDGLERIVGFRSFEAKDGRLMLNGEPFYLRAALDQDWYQETDCRAPNPQTLETRFRNAKALGLNALRCHVKIPDRQYFDLADRLGLLIWQDMPYSGFLKPETRAAFTRIFRSVVATHAHHPSICVWTLFNEGWGIDLDDNEDDRRWLIETFDWAKALVPESLVVDNSPCFPRNYHLKTDIDDFHWYSGFPLHNAQFEKNAADFAARPAWSWSPHGDALKTGREPLVCSEFGVWGLPHPKDLREADGSEPWWFESGHDWNQGAAYPHGIETRFRDAQLAPVFGDLDGFVDAAQEFQYRALKYQIETLRWHAPICGYVITELNDVQWEANGLMDARDNPRRFAERLANLQRDHLVIARAGRTALSGGERVTVPVRLACAGAPPAGARLAWRFGGQSGGAPLGAGAQEISFVAPEVTAFTALNFEMTAHDGAGRELSRNVLEFCLAPGLGADQPALFALDDGAAAILSSLRWPRVAPSADEADIALATRLTSAARKLALAGKSVHVVANSADALVDPDRALPRSDRHNFPNVEVHAREGAPWDGRWMGAFAWRRTDGPWAALPPGAMFDEHWGGLIPHHVLTGFLAPAFGGLVDAGMAVGWLHKAAGFSRRSFLGPGKLTVSTFDLTSRAGQANPLAPHLLAALMKS